MGRVQRWSVPLAIWVLAMAAIANQVAVHIVTPRDSALPTTYAAADLTVTYIDIVAGAILVLVGVAFAAMRRWPAAVAALSTSIAWAAWDWAGWRHGPTPVADLGSLVEPLVGPSALFLALTSFSLRPHPPITLRLCAVVALATLLSSTVHAITYDPFFDPGCWQDCVRNAFLVVSGPTQFAGVATFATSLMVAIAGTLTLALGLLESQTRPRVRPVAAVAATVLGIGLTGFAVVGMSGPAASSTGAFATASYVLVASTLIMSGARSLWVAVDTWRQRAALRVLAESLSRGPAPGRFGATLATALRDPDLRVLFPSDDLDLIDEDGQAAPIRDREERTTTTIARRGHPVAILLHGSPLAWWEIERQLGAGTRLAIDNAGLRARALANLRRLRLVQGRIIDTADGERRRLERDLHDGAQQRLLALAVALRRAESEAAQIGDPGLAEPLASARASAERILVELREVAHGLYPAVLYANGLGEALRSLAEQVPVAVDVHDGGLSDRPPANVEAAAYAFTVEVLRVAGLRRTEHLHIALAQRDGSLVASVDGLTDLTASDLRYAADRAGALGGSLNITDADGRARVELVIPCV